MTNPPKQPTSPGPQFEYLRQTTKHFTQRGAASDGHAIVSTKGSIPKRSKSIPVSRGNQKPVWLSP